MENKVYKLSKYVLKRYEENANDEGGLEILYNTQTNQYWMGNAASRHLINSFDGEKTLYEIYIELAAGVFCDFSLEDIKESFEEIIKELETKNFINLL